MPSPQTETDKRVQAGQREHFDKADAIAYAADRLARAIEYAADIYARKL